MTEIARLSRATAKQNPGEVFENPAALAAEVMLTRGEKLGALERWRRDVLLEMTATGEGMRADPHTGRPARLLREIDAAIRELSPADNHVPAK
ncbi:MAG: hypothetical protein AB7L90_01570 [Hyphomicrobiaceae bacterium]